MTGSSNNNFYRINGEINDNGIPPENKDNLEEINTKCFLDTGPDLKISTKHIFFQNFTSAAFNDDPLRYKNLLNFSPPPFYFNLPFHFIDK